MDGSRKPSWGGYSNLMSLPSDGNSNSSVHLDSQKDFALLTSSGDSSTALFSLRVKNEIDMLFRTKQVPIGTHGNIGFERASSLYVNGFLDHSPFPNIEPKNCSLLNPKTPSRSDNFLQSRSSLPRKSAIPDAANRPIYPYHRRTNYLTRPNPPLHYQRLSYENTNLGALQSSSLDRSRFPDSSSKYKHELFEPQNVDGNITSSQPNDLYQQPSSTSSYEYSNHLDYQKPPNLSDMGGTILPFCSRNNSQCQSNSISTNNNNPHEYLQFANSYGLKGERQYSNSASTCSTIGSPPGFTYNTSLSERTCQDSASPIQSISYESFGLGNHSEMYSRAPKINTLSRSPFSYTSANDVMTGLYDGQSKSGILSYSNFWHQQVNGHRENRDNLVSDLNRGFPRKSSTSTTSNNSISSSTRVAEDLASSRARSGPNRGENRGADPPSPPELLIPNLSGGIVYQVRFKCTSEWFLPASDAYGIEELSIGNCVKVEADRGESIGFVEQCLSFDNYLALVEINPPEKAKTSASSPAVDGEEGVKSSVGSTKPGRRRKRRGKDSAQVKALDDFDAENASTSNENPDNGLANLKCIMRRATRFEQEKLVFKANEEVQVLKLCREKVKLHKLPMKIVDAEFQFDRNKLTFFFKSERRIDFRELVRELFSLYKTRIWMEQVKEGDCLYNDSDSDEDISESVQIQSDLVDFTDGETGLK